MKAYATRAKSNLALVQGYVNMMPIEVFQYYNYLKRSNKNEAPGPWICLLSLGTCYQTIFHKYFQLKSVTPKSSLLKCFLAVFICVRHSVTLYII